MTDPGLMALDPGFARALDLFDVPAASSDFLARAGAMPAADAPALPPAPRRRFFESGRRGTWVRRASVGIIALGLASATAATTGVFPAFKIDVPKFVAALNPLSSPKPKAAHLHTHKPVEAVASIGAATQAPLDVVAPPLVQPPLPVGLPLGRAAQIKRAIRREETVDIIQQQLADHGMDVPKPLIRRKLAQRQAAHDVAIGMVLRGDDRPLPPRMEKMREHARAFLDTHPQAAARLRDRVAAADAGLLPNAPIPPREAAILRPDLAARDRIAQRVDLGNDATAPQPVMRDNGEAPSPQRTPQANVPDAPQTEQSAAAPRPHGPRLQAKQMQRLNERRAIRQQRLLLRRMRNQ